MQPPPPPPPPPRNLFRAGRKALSVAIAGQSRAAAAGSHEILLVHARQKSEHSSFWSDVLVADLESAWAQTRAQVPHHPLRLFWSVGTSRH